MAPLLERGNKRSSAAERAFLGIPSRTSFTGRCGGEGGRQSSKNTPELKQISLGVSIASKHQSTLQLQLPLARLETALSYLDAVTVTPPKKTSVFLWMN